MSNYLTIADMTPVHQLFDLKVLEGLNRAQVLARSIYRLANIQLNTHVVHLNGVECILGMDTLKSQNISFHLGKGVFWFGDGIIFKLHRHANRTSANLTPAKSPRK